MALATAAHESLCPAGSEIGDGAHTSTSCVSRILASIAASLIATLASAGNWLHYVQKVVHRRNFVVSPIQ